MFPRRLLTEQRACVFCLRSILQLMLSQDGYKIAVIMNEFGDTAVSLSHLFLHGQIWSRLGYRRFDPVVPFRCNNWQTLTATTINRFSTEDPMASNSEEFLELANGCLCCSIKDSGIAAIEALMIRKGGFDYVVLETTGLADPGDLLLVLFVGHYLCADG